jgi:hypothetical protein
VSWQDDPEVQRQIRMNAARGKIMRSMILWMPLFLASLGGLLWFGFDLFFNDGENGGTGFLLVILLILTVLFGFQAIQNFLDYFGEPRVERGIVTRRWARNDSLVLRTHYMRIGKNILRGDAYLLDGIREGDYVEVTFYPNSALLIWAEQREDPNAPAAVEEERSAER